MFPYPIGGVFAQTEKLSQDFVKARLHAGLRRIMTSRFQPISRTHFQCGCSVGLLRFGGRRLRLVVSGRKRRSMTHEDDWNAAQPQATGLAWRRRHSAVLLAYAAKMPGIL